MSTLVFVATLLACGQDKNKSTEGSAAQWQSERDTLLKEKKALAVRVAELEKQLKTREGIVDGNLDARAQTVLAEVTVKAEHEEEFVAYIEKFVATVHEKEPGTVVYAFLKHKSEPLSYLFVERYRDVEALKAHGESEHLAKAFADVKDWVTVKGQEYTQIYPR